MPEIVPHMPGCENVPANEPRLNTRYFKPAGSLWEAGIELSHDDQTGIFAFGKALSLCSESIESYRQDLTGIFEYSTLEQSIRSAIVEPDTTTPLTYASTNLPNPYILSIVEQQRRDGTIAYTISTKCHEAETPLYDFAFDIASDALRYQTSPDMAQAPQKRAKLAIGALAAATLVTAMLSPKLFNNDEPSPAAHSITSAPTPHTTRHPHPSPSPDVQRTPHPTTSAPSETPSLTPAPSQTAAPELPPSPLPPPPPPVTPFTIATFNVLGASHTDNSGGKAYGELPRAKKRTAMATDFILSHNIEVVGLQEFQSPQRRALLDRLGAQYDIYPSKASYGHHFSENSIIWNAQRFKLLDAGKTDVFYFGGSTAYVPWALLQDKTSGKDFYVFNTHDPADTSASPHNSHWRKKDARIHRADAEKFSKTGKPLFFLGDFNASGTIRKVLTPCASSATVLIEAEFASRDKASKCPVDSLPDTIDHIFVTPTNIAIDDVQRLATKNMTDHPVLALTATLL